MRIATTAMVLGALLVFVATADAAGTGTDQTPATVKPRDTLANGTRLDVNKATREELVALPGIGPATAQAIIDLRTSKGSFSRIEDLLEVRGIGPKNIKKLSALLAVYPKSPASSTAPVPAATQ